MEEYPWNSVLHNACELFVTEVIESDDEALKLSLFTQDNLYVTLRRRIVDATKEKWVWLSRGRVGERRSAT